MDNYIEKVSAIIIKDKKLLLVSSAGRSFFWNPGGKLEPDESLEEGLKRELKEELNIDVINLESYFDYDSKREEDGSIRRVHSFIVDYQGNLLPKNEIDRILWLSKKEFLKDNSNIQIGVRENLIPRLIIDNLL